MRARNGIAVPEANQVAVIEARAVALSDGTRLEVRQPLDVRWRTALSLRGRTASYTDRVHALILFLARLRVGKLAIEGSEDGWAPYACIAQLPGWEQCRDPQRLRETLLHELDLVTGVFFQRSTLDGRLRIRIAQSSGTFTVDVAAGASPSCETATRDGTPVRHDSRLALDSAGTVGVAEEVTYAATLGDDVAWRETRDFAEGISRVVRAWMARLELAVDVDVIPSSATGGPPAPGEVGIPLADGSSLSLRSIHAGDTRSGDALDHVRRYVAEQNWRVSAITEARAQGMTLASKAICAVFVRVVESARRGRRVLLMGPSGSGKEGLARTYHRHARPTGQFIAKNCGLLSRDLTRVELFGAEQGAYTSATRRVTGAVEAADRGTLFLDEIGEMPLEVQSQLLSFLDHGEYHRVGSSNLCRADVSVVCATNRNLREAVIRSQFREDLWYRLSQDIVEVPALCERPEDVEAYLRARVSPSGASVWERLTHDAVSMLIDYGWPGNFRELANFVARIHDDGGRLDGNACRRNLQAGALRPSGPPVTTPALHSGAIAWGELAQQAASAFAEDAGYEARSWDDLKAYIENYLKPLLFARLSGADSVSSDIALRELASRINADRGTVYKQLARYRERFHR